MAKDPAFIFYPGDYLRDTQCLSEAVQVAYDRIMCEHIRNICISEQQLSFFTKKLNDSEKEELLMVLEKTTGGYQIAWVAASINTRRSYSESRAKNRKGKNGNIEDSKEEQKERIVERMVERIPSVSQLPIPTLEECESYFISQHSTKELGQKFFNKYDGVGWKDANGMWIMKWRSTANNWIKRGDSDIEKKTDKFSMVQVNTAGALELLRKNRQES